jgi:hypothetical protein
MAGIMTVKMLGVYTGFVEPRGSFLHDAASYVKAGAMDTENLSMRRSPRR